jgi:hypothetical protein
MPSPVWARTMRTTVGEEEEEAGASVTGDAAAAEAAATVGRVVVPKQRACCSLRGEGRRVGRMVGEGRDVRGPVQAAGHGPATQRDGRRSGRRFGGPRGRGPWEEGRFNGEGLSVRASASTREEKKPDAPQGNASRASHTTHTPPTTHHPAPTHGLTQTADGVWTAAGARQHAPAGAAAMLRRGANAALARPRRPASSSRRGSMEDWAAAGEPGTQRVRACACRKREVCARLGARCLCVLLCV